MEPGTPPKAGKHVMNRVRRWEEIYLILMIRSDGLMDICKDYNLKKYSSANTVVENVKKKLLKDPKFSNRVNELSKRLINSQPETGPLYYDPFISSI